MKVAHLPPNVQIKPNADPAAEYVRFYLIEPTTKGVKLKGCSNEPVFGEFFFTEINFKAILSYFHDEITSFLYA